MNDTFKILYIRYLMNKYTGAEKMARVLYGQSDWVPIMDAVMKFRKAHET